jgi:hypothetical protein
MKVFCPPHTQPGFPGLPSEPPELQAATSISELTGKIYRDFFDFVLRLIEFCPKTQIWLQEQGTNTEFSVCEPSFKRKEITREHSILQPSRQVNRDFPGPDLSSPCEKGTPGRRGQ